MSDAKKNRERLYEEIDCTAAPVHRPGSGTLRLGKWQDGTLRLYLWSEGDGPDFWTLTPENANILRGQICEAVPAPRSVPVMATYPPLAGTVIYEPDEWKVTCGFGSHACSAGETG